MRSAFRVVIALKLRTWTAFMIGSVQFFLESCVEWVILSCIVFNTAEYWASVNRFSVNKSQPACELECVCLCCYCCFWWVFVCLTDVQRLVLLPAGRVKWRVMWECFIRSVHFCMRSVWWGRWTCDVCVYMNRINYERNKKCAHELFKAHAQISNKAYTQHNIYTRNRNKTHTTQRIYYAFRITVYWRLFTRRFFACEKFVAVILNKKT